jgi:hypothetical protein
MCWLSNGLEGIDTRLNYVEAPRILPHREWILKALLRVDDGEIGIND